MDGNHFDDVSRRLGRLLDRRRAVAGLIGLAATAVDRGSSGASRRTCRANGVSCLRGSQCCIGACDTRRSTPRPLRNRCGCPYGTVQCGIDCVDLQTDAENCGACGHACENGAPCVDGVCDCTDLSCLPVPANNYPITFQLTETCGCVDSCDVVSDIQGSAACTTDEECADSSPKCSLDGYSCRCTRGMGIAGGSFFLKDPYGRSSCSILGERGVPEICSAT